MIYIAYILLGMVAGFLAGLLGVGGGLVIVPVLILVFQASHFAPDIIVHMAIATSLATIVFTSLSSIYAHHFHHQAIRWDVVKHLAPGIVVGALLGAVIADMISASGLRRFFGFFELFVALQMGLNLRPYAGRQLPGKPGQFIAGTVIGSISAIVGIGGGTLTVPFLVWCNVRMQNAVATSSACGLPIAIAGAAGFMLTGLNEVDLPAWSTGYVYWPAWLMIVVSSILFAPLGAKVAHRVPAARLKRFFALLLLLLGLRMLW